jgi:hypothetical protein
MDERGWGWEGFREGVDYPGRPDLPGHGGSVDWGIVKAKKHLPYVHSVAGNAMLIHKVACVEIRWYEGHYCYMKRMEQPYLIAITVCGVSRRLNSRRGKAGAGAKMCEIPDPNAVLCGLCHGELPTFSKKRKTRIKKRWAKDHLGCKGVVEVIGPYAASQRTP